MEDNKKPVEIKQGLTFPSQLAPFSEKEGEDFGLGLARAIESEYFYRQGGAKCKFFTQRESLVERRIYAKGLQSMQKYKQQLGTNGDLSFLNLSTKPLSIIPKLVDIVCNGMANRDYSIRATAIDPISQDNRVEYRKRIENDMLAKEVLLKAQETFGQDVSNFPIEQLPESKEELDLHMQLEYKQSIEMSEELAIDTVLQENRYSDTTEKMVAKDVTVLGVGWAKHRFVPSRGIILEYVDPENKMQSYSEDPFYRDCFWHGEYKTVLISDILVEYPWINENTELKKQLEFSSENWWNYQGLGQNERIKGTTNILYFTYKTTRERAKKIKEKSTGTKIVSDAKEIFDEQALKEKGRKIDFKRVSVVEEVEFEGVYVLGTSILLKWEVCQNMTRPKSNKQKVIDQYIGVAPNREKGYIDSLVARMIPIEDKLNVLELKADQIIQKITPDGYQIDVDALADMDLGDGKALTPNDHLTMLLQTGSIFVRSYTSGGEYNYAKSPITELRTGDSLNKLQSLRNEREGYMNLMRDVIGMNKASDGSSPDKDSLLGVQKLAALNSNIATRHILDAKNDITKRIAEAVTYRIADLLKYSDLKEDFARKIGATAVLDLDYVKELHLHDFAIFLDLAQDDEERARLEADLSLEIQKGFIDTSDKYKVLNVKNQKLAVQYLAILRKKRQKQQEEQKAREYQVQADQNIRSAQEAEKAKQQTFMLEAQVKGQLEEMKNNGMLAKIQAQGQVDQNNLLTEYQLKEKLQYVINQGGFAKQEYQESKKDDRVLKEATAQSALIDQRQKDGPERDFEAENSGMEIFDVRT